MAVRVQVADMLDMIGHDGSEVVWPDLSDPHCRRGHHTQECLAASLMFGYAFTPMLPTLVSAPSLHVEPYFTETILGVPTNERFDATVNHFTGVLCGQTNSGAGHAVAFDAGRIYDPDGFIYPYGDINFQPYQLWLRHDLSATT